MSITGAPERGEERNGQITYWRIEELITFLTWGRKHTSRSRKNRVPNKMKTNRSTPRHIIKLQKFKE